MYFQSDLDQQALLNVDGADVSFRHTSGSIAELDKVGETAVQTFTASDLVATVNWTVTQT